MRSSAAVISRHEFNAPDILCHRRRHMALKVVCIKQRERLLMAASCHIPNVFEIVQRKFR
jgi:hypothetical protein